MKNQNKVTFVMTPCSNQDFQGILTTKKLKPTKESLKNLNKRNEKKAIELQKGLSPKTPRSPLRAALKSQATFARTGRLSTATQTKEAPLKLTDSTFSNQINSAAEADTI